MFGNKGRKSIAIQTLIGDGTRIEGDLRFEGGCHIDGLVNGAVIGGNDPGAFLSVSEHGRVQGNVHVPHLSLSGTVEGDVVVTDRVELGPTARVIGNVHYNLIEIAAGAEINGNMIRESKPIAAPVRTAKGGAATAAGLKDTDLDDAVKQGG